MKLGYNEPLGTAKFVRYNREFIIIGIVYGITHRFGTKKFVHYNREFVITEFVITEFDCTIKRLDTALFNKYIGNLNVFRKSPNL